MPMAFHEYPGGMVVMDGRRCVAVAHNKPAGSRFWQCRIHAGAWADARTDELKIQLLARNGIRPGPIVDHLKMVEGKRAARRLFQELARDASGVRRIKLSGTFDPKTEVNRGDSTR